MRNIALYGGAFDPPHNGHIQLIHALSKAPTIDEVWLLPCGDRKDKKLVLPTSTRLNLIRSLFKQTPSIKVSEQQIELSKQKGDQVHTYDLMKHMLKKYEGSRFHFVVGADVLLTIHTWDGGQQLRQEYPFIVLPRKGYELPVEKLPPQHHFLDASLPEISSSYLKKIILSEETNREDKEKALSEWVDKIVLDCLREQKVI